MEHVAVDSCPIYGSAERDEGLGWLVYLNVVLIPMCFLVGVFGYIYTKSKSPHNREGRKCRFTHHMYAVSVWDLLMLATLLLAIWPCYFMYGRAEWPNQGSDSWMIVLMVVHVVKCASRIGMHWQTVIMSVERYCAIWQPLRSRYVLDAVSVTMVFLVVLLAAIGMSTVHVLQTFHKMDCEVAGGNLKMLVQDYSINNTLSWTVTVPFLLLHCPTPCLILLYTTFGALYLSLGKNRLAGKQVHIPVRSIVILSVNNLKFLVANTAVALGVLFDCIYARQMLNKDKNMSLTSEYYYNRTQFTDLTNALLALHCASNWPMFVRFDRSLSARSFRSTNTQSSLTMNVNNAHKSSMITTMQKSTVSLAPVMKDEQQNKCEDKFTEKLPDYGNEEMNGYGSK